MSFITGSRVYGTPTEKSDIDLVVLMDKETRGTLGNASANEGFLRFNKLNIIAVTDMHEYLVWWTCKEKCLEVKEKLGRPLTREEAVDIHVLIGNKYNYSFEAYQ